MLPKQGSACQKTAGSIKEHSLETDSARPEAMCSMTPGHVRLEQLVKLSILRQYLYQIRMWTVFCFIPNYHTIIQNQEITNYTFLLQL